MSTMTKIHFQSDATATALSNANAVMEESFQLKATRDEEMGDIFSSTTVKDSSNRSMSRSASVDLAVEDVPPASAAIPPVTATKSKGKPLKAPVQLVGHLPRAEEEALQCFTEISKNSYQYGTLGKSREALESMTCDCQYDPGYDDADAACGHHSDCINRLTQVECLPEDCRCGIHCQNQRFQRRQYAPIEIVKTEMKGFGLRAAADLHKDTFIYEYVGDVVSHPSFLKRMRQYAEEGIRHFYFMMLQRDEFIDATKRGGIGRFANHSCNPNCYVAKWTVGEYVRMGIFANRPIKKDEELTFNYNVDRYGHDAQPCYCGEPNCVGFIGGKTQTDLAAMDDLYLDALGIAEEVERYGLKGSKKKKGKKLDEDFIPDLKPLILKDVPKVVQAMRQTQSRKVLMKLLMRIKLTEDLSALRQIMRLRGFSVMTNVLEDYGQDVEVKTLAIECMMTWPLIQRNKVEDSKVHVPVQSCADSDNENLSALAKKLLAHWETLEYAYRIPKRVKGEDDGQPAAPIILLYNSDDERPTKRSRAQKGVPRFVLPSERIRPQTPPPPEPIPYVHQVDWREELAAHRAAETKRQNDVAAIIAAAAKAAEEASKAKAQAVADPSTSAAPPSRKQSSSSRHRKEKEKEKKHVSKEEREANKEKRLLKLIGVIVVKCMSKYRDQLDHDQFKKYAKELTHVIAEKEKKSSSYKEGKLEALSEEKTIKIKKFAKEYIAKVLRKLEKSGKRRKPVSTAASSSTPDSRMDLDDSAVPDATIEEVMDMDPNDDSDDDGNISGNDDLPDDSGQRHASPSGTPEDGAESGKTSPLVDAPSHMDLHDPGLASRQTNATIHGAPDSPPIPQWYR